jgi:hypothetical protein
MEIVRRRFGAGWPTTAAMTSLARELVGGGVADDPDELLQAWLQREENLFRALEQDMIRDRLKSGFMRAEGEVDISGFLSFSLSVQNRRKSRMGHSFEQHLSALFRLHELAFDTQATTEGKSRPDFLFPGARAYADPSFPEQMLDVLAAKSSCKDRWRQILVEAARVSRTHLCTLQPAISLTQTDEMCLHHVRLVVPRPLHATFTPAQRSTLLTVADFIAYRAQRDAAVR